MTAGTLPDVVLLEIFDFYLAGENDIDEVDDWHTLIHVCWRWRKAVFSSPRRLNLQLLCTPRRPITDILNIWPELPIYVCYDDFPVVEDTDNVIAALKLNGSVSRIKLAVMSNSALWNTFVAVMQDPFPMLEDLSLESYHDRTPIISDSFMGGAAPRLQNLFLRDVVFPALPNLLLSATDLVFLWLWDIPHSGYISPEAMVACMSVLTRLKSLSLQFRSPRSCPDNRGSRFLTLLKRTLLPALTYLDFVGVTEYLEDLMAQIDVPLLENTNITFFNRLVFDILQFPNLVCRTEQFSVFNQADVLLTSYNITITLSTKFGTVDSIKLKLGVSCRKLDWQLSALAQVCNSCLPTLPSLERLSICDEQYLSPAWQDDMENTQWLELLHPFVAVKDLYLSKKVALRVASALQGLSEERAIEVLPALQGVFIDGLQPSGRVRGVFQKFVTTRGRQVSGHPVAIHSWMRGKGG